VEKAVLPAVMDVLSAGKIEFGGGNGGTGDGGKFSVDAKYDAFGTFDDEYDDE
jgi:hypothetical protein